jgi:tetratricopeptide (TPR) repeat protein
MTRADGVRHISTTETHPIRTGPAPVGSEQTGVTDLLLDRADDLLTNGRAGQAASLLTPVVGAEPGNGVAWLLLARARMALGAYGEALGAARTALGLNARGVEELYWVSAAYTALGRHDLAITAAAASAEEDPGNPRPAERYGRALLAAGRTAEAESLLAVAAEIAHYDADVQVAYGMALFAAGRPLSAREAYSRALRLAPGHERALSELRRLTVAEERILDAESLVRVADEFAESLRVPAGGVRRESSAAAHVAAVVFGVCLAALLGLAVLVRIAGADVPMPLLVSVFCATGSAACLTAYLRRR